MALQDNLMRSAKSVRSVRSMKSSKSLKSLKSSLSHCYEPHLKQLTFEEALPSTCRKYNCSYNVFIRREYQQDEFYQQLKERPVKYKKISVLAPTPVSQGELLSRHETKSLATATVASSERDTSISDQNQPVIFITAVYNNSQNLTEIKLSKVDGVIPRSLIQMFGFLSSSYEYLVKITITRCKIDSTIVYELSKLEYITDICLDGSPVREGNYYIFLDRKNSRLKYLSLSRCNINDEVCKQIATRLHFLCPAEKTMMLLNLSSNHITDEGAKHLGQALRSNRRLRYLNLADNHICDDGARAILDALIDFPLTEDENKDRKQRLVSYIREKNTLISNFLNECNPLLSDEYSQVSRKMGKRNRAAGKKESKKDKSTPTESYNTKAELFANEIMGPFIDPFKTNCIIKKADDCFYSLGNMVLCYLNLSYNQLGYLSVKKLMSVLQRQSIAKKFGQSGLIKVVVEGNPMPTYCKEYQKINELIRLGKIMQPFGGRLAGVQKKRSTRISLLQSPSNSGQSG